MIPGNIEVSDGENTIGIFRSGFFIFLSISIFFYFKIFNFFSKIKIKNKLKIYSILANLFLFIYIVTLGREGNFFETSRRVSIILYIAIIYLAHFHLTNILNFLRHKRNLNFNQIYVTSDCPVAIYSHKGLLPLGGNK